MSEVMYRCREQINLEEDNSVWIIKRNFSFDDEMTKGNPNATLRKVLTSNTHEIPNKRVFMLRRSLYLRSTFIPTSKVPMQNNITITQQFQFPLSLLLSLFRNFHDSPSNTFWLYPPAEPQRVRIKLYWILFFTVPQKLLTRSDTFSMVGHPQGIEMHDET